MECKDFLYFLDKDANVVFFNPISFWNSEKSAPIYYLDDEDAFIENMAKQLGLVGTCESGYAPVNGRSVASLENRLLEYGFIFNEKFVKFMKAFRYDSSDTSDSDDLFDDLDDEPEELNFD